jgi:hypothetical protein
MALSESALSELLDALTDRERGVDLVRELAQYLAQELIEVQATQAVGAARYERSDERVTERNGHRDRVLTTKAGDLELAIPKLRKGSFFPSILEPRRRIDQALYAVVMEAYVSGVSTRSVDALVESMGAASGIKKSEVSRICAGLDERVTAFRNRTLGHTEFPYVYLDAIYVHVRDDAAHRSCHDAEAYATRIEALDARWREQLGRVRANSAVELLLDVLPGVPVTTVESAAQLIGRSEMRTGEAINRLEAAGVLRQRNIGRQRYRVFEAGDVVELFTGLERALASPTGATAAPKRRVPRRVKPTGDGT